MRIGILTLPLGRNYGGILQNWALQKVLEDWGHEVVTITHSGRGRFVKMKRFCRNLFAFLTKHLIFYPSRSLHHLPWDYRPYTKLHNFIKKYINKTQYIEASRLRSYCTKNLDVLLIGSDQVWRPEYNQGYLSTMFADFMPMESSVQLLTYAASFGVNTWEFDNAQTQMAKTAIKKFDMVTVREDSGVNLCQDYLGIDAVNVLDPTLLLDAKYYDTLLDERCLKNVPYKCIGVYFLDLDENKQRMIESICMSMNAKPYYFGKWDSDEIDVDSIEHWLTVFKKCSFIITDSFHGTAFSINYNKPFLVFVNHGRGSDRFTSLLKKVGLNNRALYNVDLDAAISITKMDIDWASVNRILDAERINSKSLLKQGITGGK